jgi:putative hemolysin
MDLVAKDDINPVRALAKLPPLFKGYLRLNGFVGDGAVIDHQFNTVDICMLVEMKQVSEKYYRHYIGTTTQPDRK